MLNQLLRSRPVGFLVGILLPILWLSIDSVVFRHDVTLCGTPLFPRSFQILFYSTVGLILLALAVWLLFGPRLPQYVPFLASLLWVGTIFAIGNSLVISLLTLLGAVIGPLFAFFLTGRWENLINIGLLVGLIISPWLTAQVFLLNARQAWAQAQATTPARPRRWAEALVGVIFLCACVWALYQPLNHWLPPAPAYFACPQLDNNSNNE